MVRWTKICKHKKKGGLGINDLKKMNVSLLCKWWWKLDNKSGLWQDIVKFKYLKKDSICTVKHRQNDSAIWSDLLKVRNIYLQGRKMVRKPCFGKIFGYFISHLIICSQICSNYAYSLIFQFLK